MSLKPLVTVYIATHNRSKLLLRAVKSVLNQTYSNIELIVADDGSSDDTSIVLQPYILNKQLIYIKSAQAQGACFVRNLAINQAKGVLITGLDDDDSFTCMRIEELVSFYQNTGYSCVASSICERTPEGDINRNHDAGEVSLDALLHYDILGNQILTKTEYLKEIGGFDPMMPAFQDYDTWVRLVARFGDAFKLKSTSYILYSEHGESRISDNKSKRLAGFKLFLDKHQNKMTRSHLNSMTILEKRLNGQRYSFIDFLRCTNKGNYIASCSYFINANLLTLRSILNAIRTKNNEESKK